MTPQEFQRKWQGHSLSERSAYQQHFLDLCDLVGHPKPAEVDKDGSWFCFEKHVVKQFEGKGFADVWKRDFFGWEYKGPHADLEKALQQLVLYRRDLGNPPLLVVCDTDIIRVHTDFTNTANTVYEITTDDIDDPARLDILRKVFYEPEALRPGRTPDQITQEVASRIGGVAVAMRERGVDPHLSAHFLMKLVFSLFAEDIGLLRRGLVTDILEHTKDDPDTLEEILGELFGAMATGGRLSWERIDHFNGGLFDDALTVRLEPSEIAALATIARDDWSQVEPAIFGTLFERGLDPSRRAQLGAHYTSKEDILLVIEPVLMKPLREEWEQVRAECDELAKKASGAKDAGARTRARRRLNDRLRAFMERLAEVRVLDPACGSGNFLYVALNSLKDLELEVIQAASDWSAEVPFPSVDPGQLYGLEIDTYAVELAQLTVWIGYLQWCQQHGFLGSDRPLLKQHDNIEQRDAILAFDEEGSPVEPEWPEVDVIVGNPPFLGSKKIRAEL
ncbi:MAG: class I SAM-dependent DNA methyltransferase, partial [Armatimonadia bacterium]|nr:class I SAM-dependent DNA methyltransferase [Armatimonadia bacterium]